MIDRTARRKATAPRLFDLTWTSDRLSGQSLDNYWPFGTYPSFEEIYYCSPIIRSRPKGVSMFILRFLFKPKVRVMLNERDFIFGQEGP